MKNKGIISATIGTAFFAIPYVALSVAFAPSLIIGVAAYGASELLLSDNKKLEEIKKQNNSVEKILKDAELKNNELTVLITQLENEETKNNLSEITTTIIRIIKTIKKNPTKIKHVENFFDYYLPVLFKIVNRYDEVENQGLSSKEGKEFLSSTDKMVKEANVSFKKVLNRLYQTDIVDADAEMKVFNTMLKADGLSGEIITKERDV